MNDEVKNEQSVGNDADYIDMVNEVQKNSVPRSDYENLEAKHKKLFEAYINREKIDLPTQPKESVQDLRNKLFGKDCGKISDMEFIQGLLDLRTQLMESGERDPALPTSNSITVSQELMDDNDIIHAGLQAMLDGSDGNNGVFIAKYQAGTVDPVLPTGKKRK